MIVHCPTCGAPWNNHGAYSDPGYCDERCASIGAMDVPEPEDETEENSPPAGVVIGAGGSDR